MGIAVSVGSVLEVVGVCVTAVGVWTTWRHFKSPDDRFLAPVIEPARNAARASQVRLITWTRRLFRRPAPRIVGIGTLSVGIGTMKASVRVGYGPLPSDSGAALSELHRRTGELMNSLSDAKERFDEDRDEVRAALQAIRNELGIVAASVNARSQEAALDGVRTEALGLFLVGLGVLLQDWIVTIY